jgi:outer membrane lipoprotein-sorting protein
VTPSGPCRPSSSLRRRRRLEASAALLLLGACAHARVPPPEVVRAAAGLASYSASLRVSVRGAELRGRSRALVAFRRPDALRIEIPGPAGARLLAVARGGRLTAVMPHERAVFEAEASPAGLESLIGIALRPDELMDLLVGVAPEGAQGYEVRWGRTLPRRVDAVLADGTKLRATVEDADAGTGLAAAAFDPPPHAGYRPVDASEARRLLGGR